MRASVVGGGLAGCEAAWALAERGVSVTLHEMRPVRGTPAHQTDTLAELVCSNSFKSVETVNAHGLLKAEMRLLGSINLQAADVARVLGARRSPWTGWRSPRLFKSASPVIRTSPWSAAR